MLKLRLEEFWIKISAKLINCPKSATREEWDAWHKKTKKERPVLYWVVYELDRKIHKYITRPLSDLKWAIIWRYHPNHQYNKVKLSLEPGYYDPDDRILYAIFDITSEFVEWNKKEKLFDWSYNAEHKKTWDELVAINNWWKKERSAAWKKHDAESLKIYRIKNQKEKDKAYKAHWKQEEALHKKDEEMICRVAKIRRSMWY